MSRAELGLLLGLLAVACADTKEREEEGANERDTGPRDTRPGGQPSFDWSGVEAELSGEEVCYPGADGATEVCIPTVDHSDDWGPSYAYPPPLDGDPQYLAPSRYIDLSSAEASPRLQLATNFQLNELMQEYKGRFALFQVHAVESLQLLREAVGGPIYVNSAYRNVDYNAGVGGATWSRHLYGDAVDIRSDDASLEELADLCTDLGAGFTSVYTSHVHCDWRDTPLDPSFFDRAAAASPSPVPVAAELHIEEEGLRVSWSGFDEGRPQLWWTGFDADGQLVATHRDAHWTPPEAVVWLEVDVGRSLRLQHALP